MKRLIPCLLAPSICHASSAPILCKHKPKVPSPLRHVVSLDPIIPTLVEVPSPDPMRKTFLKFTFIQLEDLITPGDLTPDGSFLMDVFCSARANDPKSKEKADPK